jgi:hypothetical protein
MNTRVKTLVMAVAVAAAASALSAQADPETFWETPLAHARLKPETAHQAAENEWLTAQRTLDSVGGGPIPFPVPNAAPEAAKISVETPHQAAEDKWFTAQRTVGGSGSPGPIPFPVTTSPGR